MGKKKKWLNEIQKDVFKIASRVLKNEILLVSEALSFRFILTISPFIVCVLTLLAGLNIDYKKYIGQIFYIIPVKIQDIILFIAEELFNGNKAGIFSLSLFIAVYNASTGFSMVIKVLNRSYGIKETRNIFVRQFLSIFLMFIFIIAVIGTIGLVIIKELVLVNMENGILINIFTETAIIYILLGLTYKIAVNKRTRFKEVRAGALFTSVLWVLASEIFDFVTNYIIDYSAVYGALGAIFIFFYWINILAFIFLVGGEINAYGNYYLNNKQAANIRRKRR